MDRSGKRLFAGYGWLAGISYEDYLSDLLNWVYEDSDEYDGIIIASNEMTGEVVYVKGSNDRV